MIYVYVFKKCDVRWPENSVRFEKFDGNWLPDGSNSVRLKSHSVRYGCMKLLSRKGISWKQNDNLITQYEHD